MAHESHGTVWQRIWVPFFILLGITILEFAIAFTIKNKTLTTPVYMILTIAKAFYIVAYFMHLKFERITFIYTFIVPVLFLLYLVVLLMIEGGSLFEHYHVMFK
jgi:caa(3)-type oxidase subunit IV